MYYLLGYKLFGEKEGEMMQKLQKMQKTAQKNRAGDHVGKSAIFGDMEEDLLNQVWPLDSLKYYQHFIPVEVYTVFYI